MTTVTGRDLVAMFDAVAAAIDAQRDHLCALDGVIGDADHGVTMQIGFSAVRTALAGLGDAAEPSQIFNTAAKSFLNAVGASAGPLYATAFMRAGAAVKGKPALETGDIVAIVSVMAAGIQDRGKAVEGEKTMVDAWAPAAKAIREAGAAGKPLAECLAAAVAAADAGAQATAGMIATKGRSARLGERARGHVDAGAASAVIVLEAMSRSLNGAAA